MALIIVPVGGTTNINQSETDTVSFLGLGTLNIAGVPGAPITVTLSQVGGVGLLETINISDANVTVGGVAGVTGLARYNIGSGGTLNLTTTVGVTAGSSIAFTGMNSHLVLGSAVSLSALSGISGFGPGSTIDVSPLATSVTYADAAGANTGGTLTLRNAGGTAVSTIALQTGDFVAGNFKLTPDGTGGTIVGFGTAVTGVTATPGTADLGVGAAVVLTVSTTNPVSITGGVPTLALNDGGTATYNAVASTPTSLVFNYTVGAGQNTADLAVTGVATNGATIIDTAGIAADLSGAAVNPAGTLQIDTTAPTFLAAVTSPATADLGAGQVVTFTVTPSEAVTVSGGTPTLTLNDSGTATYNAAASTPTSLVFVHTVAAGQNAADLAITGAALNGATIADGAGNAGDISTLVGNPAGILQIDTIRPVVTGVTTNPASGSVGPGQVVSIALATSEPVTVTGGTPTLSLGGGGTATYNPTASTPGNLVFDYTVGAGQNIGDLTVTGTSLGTATVADGAGNPIDLSGAVGNPPGVLTVDTTAPLVTSVTTNPATADLGVGRTVTFTVTGNEALVVAGGTPSLTLNDGGTAVYSAAASSGMNLAFVYTVAAGQNTADLTVTAASANGATVTDVAGNALNLASTIGNPAGILQIDTTAPLVTSVTTSPASGTVSTGQGVTLTVATSEPVTVAGGTPTLTLSGGGTATYNAAASSPSGLVFNYTVAPGQDTADLSVTAASLNGAVIADGAGNALSLTGAVGNPPGTLVVSTSYSPFTALAASAGDGSQIVTVTATQRPTEPGTYSNTGSGSVSQDGLTYSVTGTASQVNAALQGVQFNPGSGATTPVGLSATITGTAPGASLFSGAGDDVLTGSTGDNVLSGGAGNDILIGGGGNDSFIGGAGADQLIGGSGFDLAYYDQAPAGVTANLVSGGTGGDAAGDTYSGIDGLVGSAFNDTLTGDAGINLLAGGLGNDTLDGGDGNDALFGQEGDDILLGGGGNDLLRGGPGADSLDGGSGFNLAIYDTATAGVQVSLATIGGNTGEAAGDTFTNIQGFLGSSFNDTLIGDDKSNLLLGGDGDDTLIGGVGYDVMDGGAGHNTFIFDPGFQFDHIGGFQAGPGLGDVLSFSHLIFATAQAALSSVYTDQNGDAYVYAGGTDIVVLAGVQASQLSLDDFAIR